MGQNATDRVLDQQQFRLKLDQGLASCRHKMAALFKALHAFDPLQYLFPWNWPVVTVMHLHLLVETYPGPFLKGKPSK